MSYVTKISFVPRDSGRVTTSFENVDYGFGNNVVEIKLNILERFKSYHFREINETGSYFDFVTVLTIDEFFDFHSKFLIPSQINNSESIDEFVKSIDDTIRFNWVIVEIFEIDF